MVVLDARDEEAVITGTGLILNVWVVFTVCLLLKHCTLDILTHVTTLLVVGVGLNVNV